MGEHGYRTEEESLGATIVRHRWKGMPAATVLIAVIFIGFPVGLVTAAATGALPMGEDWSFMTYVGSALFAGMPFMGAWFLLDAYRRRNDVAIIYDDGIELLQKGSRQRARFRDVVALRAKVHQQVRNGIPGPMMHRHALRCSDRSELVFTHGFEDIDGLSAKLRQKTAAHLLPRARETLRAGGAVSFGPITMTRDALAWRGATVLWRDLGVVEMAEGSVLATRAGKSWLNEDIANVDNAHVLIILARERDFATSEA